MFRNDGIVECATSLGKFPYFALGCTYRYHLTTGLECYVRHCLNRFLVSKETVVLRRWERSKQKFGFIKRVDKS